MEVQTQHTDAARIFRAAIFNGSPIPETARAVLEARGVDTQELEVRLRQSIEWSHEQ